MSDLVADDFLGNDKLSETVEHFEAGAIYRLTFSLADAGGAGVKVIWNGEVIYQDGQFTKVDRDAALKALHDDLSKALADDEVERRKLSKALLPHVKKFYTGYFDPTKHQPFYRQSSLV